MHSVHAIIFLYHALRVEVIRLEYSVKKRIEARVWACNECNS
jgi:hypothetical protein